MAKKDVRSGMRMQKGKGWLLFKKRRDNIENQFNGTLLETINFKGKRIAIFFVQKRPQRVGSRTLARPR